MTDDRQERSKVEVSNDLAYEIRLHERHARLYRRVRATLAFIALCGGASAFANLFAQPAWLSGIGGVLIASCAFLDVVFDYSGKAVAHDSFRRKALALQARASALSFEQMDAALSTLSQEDPGSIESLRRPAFHDMLRTRGYPEYVDRLNLRERIADLIA
ncbi:MULTISPECIES: hypothetical protein [Stenotrophomonas]|uniref:hypothetical protein n=1 Tax=Stenotrophomonas TaxID=40323 RepID=UPI0032EE53F1